MLPPRLTSDLCRYVAPLLLSLAAAGCASTGVVPRPFPMPPRVEVPPAAPGAAPPAPATPLPDGPADVASPDPSGAPSPTTADGAVEPVVGTALTLLGTPYVNGGSTPEGFDCSGLTQWVFAQHGIALPRETQRQFQTGDAVEAGGIEAGDLVFFSTVARGASHVGIALDEDRFVHAPSSRGVVRIERRSSAYWRTRYVGARRLHPDSEVQLTR